MTEKAPSIPIKALTSDTFKTTIQTGTVFIDFWAPWCGPCRAFRPIYEKTAINHPECTFTSVNTEEETPLAIEMGIQAIPTIQAYRDGLLIFSQVGAIPEHALEKLVGQVALLDMDQVRRELQPKP